MKSFASWQKEFLSHFETDSFDKKDFFQQESIERLQNELSLLFSQWMDWQKEPSCPFQTIAIIGMGLIGGSIAKAIKSKKPECRILTLNREDEDILLAKRSGLIDGLHSDLAAIAKEAECMVLCLPLNAILSFAEEVKRNLPEKRTKKLFILDVGSVKAEIAKTFEGLTDEEIEFLPSHPMAGTEKRSFTNSKASLFIGSPWIITPHSKNSEEGQNAAQQLVRFLGAEPKLLSPLEHDTYAGFVSHVPYILAKRYKQFVETSAQEALSIAGPGFVSFTRLAQDNAEMRRQIGQANASVIETILDRWSSFNSPSEAG
jgi:prephenate dehydrogenase